MIRDELHRPCVFINGPVWFVLEAVVLDDIGHPSLAAATFYTALASLPKSDSLLVVSVFRFFSVTIKSLPLWWAVAVQCNRQPAEIRLA